MPSTNDEDEFIWAGSEDDGGEDPETASGITDPGDEASMTRDTSATDDSSDDEENSTSNQPDNEQTGEQAGDSASSQQTADASDRDATTGTDTGAEPTPAAESDGDDEQDDAGDEEPEEVVPELHPDVYRAPFEDVDVSDPEELAQAIADIDSQAAVTIEELIRRVQDLQQEAEHYKEKAKQKQREFQNFKQRKNDEAEKLKETAAKDFIKDALPIRDNLERALDQDSDDIRSGVELIKQEFDDLLEQEGVTIIEPDAGDKVDPEVHEVMTRVESDIEEGRIHECFRPGYKMEDTVIRPARVTVSDGPAE